MNIYQRLKELADSNLIEMPQENAVPAEPTNFVYVPSITSYGLGITQPEMDVIQDAELERNPKRNS